MAELVASWKCGTRALDLGRTRLMGVLNVTPDSFSDGGQHAGLEAALAWAEKLLDDGADVIDVGGESTRPGFTPVDCDEEAARVVPVVRALVERGALVSVDTRHAQVAQAAIGAGAHVINDVSGFEDPAMVQVAAQSGCGVVAMHSCSGFLAGQQAPVHGGDTAAFVDGVEAYLLRQAHVLQDAGVDPASICIDPGPGFGTDADEDLAVQAATGRLARLGYPFLCAPSRKRFVGAVSGSNPALARDAATAGVVCAAALSGARIVRVHDVRTSAQALRMMEACSGIAPERRAYVALGSNMGDRVAQLKWAVEQLAALPQTSVVAASRAFETEPAYLGDQDLFANAVVELRTRLHPRALLESLLAIEDRAGRVRLVRNGPRCLDVDLVWMEGERHAGSRLTLPHPRMGERDFVLAPLADLVPDVEAFCAREGIACVPAERRLGRVTRPLGSLT
jgi:dihydropteroate synthase